MEISPGELANELGISESMLRRYCTIYERLYGPIPRDTRQGRVFTAETGRIFRDARESINKGHSVVDAFRMISPPEPSQAIHNNPGLAEIANLLQTIAQQNTDLRFEVQQLRQEIQGLKALPNPKKQGNGFLGLWWPQRRKHQND